MEKFLAELAAYLDPRAIDWPTLLGGALRIALVLVLIRVSRQLLRSALRRLEQRLIARDHAQGTLTTESAKRAGTLVKLLFQGATVLIWVTGLLVILREVGVQIGPILASAGIAGVALGFGAQNLVRDLIAGFFMLLENQVRVGDVVTVNGIGGLVEEVNLRTLVLRDLAGNRYFFPNGIITTLSNQTQEWSAYVFNIRVDYHADVDKAIELLRRVGRELCADAQFGPLMLGDVEVFGIDALQDAAVIVQGRLRTQPMKQWEVGREYLRRVKKAFEIQNGEAPGPQSAVQVVESARQPAAPAPTAAGNP